MKGGDEPVEKEKELRWLRREIGCWKRVNS